MKHSSYSFNYKPDRWLEVHMKFDLDRNTVEMVCEQDGRVIGERTIRYNGNIQLGGLNLYGPKYAHYYCDWLRLNCGNGYFNSDQSVASSSRSRSETVAAGQENLSLIHI